ncbi:MAG TPA: tRNA 2-thiouridine(34) synthase MnmA [Planctomycetaceae bacterium]|nr:tRNA 2-thiouridine(34) synthase MnmA [Planctomycetaceae bacterium]
MRVVLAMSGGVDSSASAWLLKEQGYEVVGLFMRSGEAEPAACATPGLLPIVTAGETGGHGDGRRDRGASPEDGRPAASHKQGCCSASDAADARRVADGLDIPFHALNFREAFGRIKDYFADEYLAGRTPNPCVMCNNWLKFGKLWEFARQVEAERIATGHYARLATREPGERPALVRGRDAAKDQSYVLFGIDRELLDRILFPVGDSTKSEIREIARRAGLRTAEKRDSQEICFIPDQDYAAFLARHREEELETAGELVDPAGNVVGRHAGYHHFTVGQRKGLGVTFGAPRYVVAIEPDTRRVVIGEQRDLARRTLEADRLNWLVDKRPERFRCRAQIRYRHAAAPADVEVLDGERLRVEFDEPQYGVSPGQAVVLYDDDRVLGGGWIR